MEQYLLNSLSDCCTFQIHRNDSLPLSSSGNINFRTFDCDLCFFSVQSESAVALSGPIYKSLNSYTCDLQVHQRVLCPHLPFVSQRGWARASKQTAECGPVIQIQTSDCCWQCLLGPQVAFICLHESSSSFSPPAALTCTYFILYSSWLQHKFPLLPPYMLSTLSRLTAADAHLCWCQLVSWKWGTGCWFLSLLGLW